ncbi:MAG: DMT family transporter [Oscillospiraceae bacterium]
MKLTKERFAEGVLLFITMIWGSSFVIANIALDAGLSPLFILMCRFFIASLVMGIVYHKRLRKNLHLKNVKPGIILGIIFLTAFYLQMIGLKYSTPSNNAIITSVNVVLVPFICWLIVKRRPAPINFVSCFISLVGIAVISVDLSSGFSLHLGDSFSVLSAVMFAAQIVAVGEMSKSSEYVTLVFTEFVTAAIIAMTLYFITEHDLHAFINRAGWIPILYLGVVCTCICFFLQAWSLRGVESSRGAVIMSLESLFGASLSIIVGIDSLNWHIVVGGLALIIAVILPEIKFFKKTLYPSLKTNAHHN